MKWNGCGQREGGFIGDGKTHHGSPMIQWARPWFCGPLREGVESRAGPGQCVHNWPSNRRAAHMEGPSPGERGPSPSRPALPWGVARNRTERRA
jgi:hypothetical protein